LSHHPLFIIPILTLTIPAIPLIILSKKKGFLGKPLLFGIGLLVLTLIIQPTIQYLPLKLLRINPNNLPLETLVYILLYTALVSGFLQEYLKYITVRNKNIVYALWVGGGFGLGETLFVLINQIAALIMGMDFSFTLGLLAVYERLTTLIYHMVSAGILAYYDLRGKGVLAYVALALVHTLINFQAMIITKTNTDPIPVLAAVYSIIAAVFIMYYMKVISHG